MRTTARDFLMDGNEGQRFRDVIDNLDEDIILDCMEEYADYKIENSAKKNKAENLFESLETAKQNMAIVFANRYFEDEYDFYWLGETLSIFDEFITLEDIQFSLENNIYEEVLFKYLSKPRKYNLEGYCLGKAGRKSKKELELKKCKERVELSKHYFQEALQNFGINKNIYGKEEDID